MSQTKSERPPYTGPKHFNAITKEPISDVFSEQLEAHYKKCKHTGTPSSPWQRLWVTKGQASHLADTPSIERRDRHYSRSVKLYLSPTPQHYAGVRHDQLKKGCTCTCRVPVTDKVTGDTKMVRVSHTYYNIAQTWASTSSR